MLEMNKQFLCFRLQYPLRKLFLLLERYFCLFGSKKILDAILSAYAIFNEFVLL